MISRIWRGWTAPSKADAYERLLRERILPGIAAKGVPGYHGAHVLRKEGEFEVEFVTIMWLDSMEDVVAFAGSDYEVAYVPEEARAVLARFDQTSQHYEVRQAP